MNHAITPATSPKPNKRNSRLHINCSTRPRFQAARFASWLGILTVLWSATPARAGQLAATIVSSIRLAPAQRILRTNQVVFEVTFSEAVTGAQTNDFPMTPVDGGNGVELVSALNGGRVVHQMTADIF